MFKLALSALSLVAAVSATTCHGTACPSAATTAHGSQITHAPRYGGDSSYQYYDQSYYSSFSKGGYSSMDCGYGYGKDSNNYCTMSSWVSLSSLYITTLSLSSLPHCCVSFADRRL
jgi:hypothetical protein